MSLCKGDDEVAHVVSLCQMLWAAKQMTPQALEKHNKVCIRKSMKILFQSRATPHADLRCIHGWMHFLPSRPDSIFSRSQPRILSSTRCSARCRVRWPVLILFSPEQKMMKHVMQSVRKSCPKSKITRECKADGCFAVEREGGGKLLLCSGCNVATFCSAACQKAVSLFLRNWNV